MSTEFPYDVFLSHRAKDKAVVRPLAERLRADVLLSHSHLSTFNSQLTCTALNRERGFLPLRFDDAPIKGCLAQFLYINWRPASHEQQGLKARKKIAQGQRSEMSTALGQRIKMNPSPEGAKQDCRCSRESP